MIKINNLATILVAILIVVSCSGNKEKHQTKHDVNNHIEQECLKNMDKEIIVENIFDSPKLRVHIKPLIQRSIKIQILENEFICQDLSIQVDGLPVIIQDSVEATEHTFRIKSLDLNCEIPELLFSVWYPFEHAVIDGKAIKENGNWQIEITGSGVID